MLPPISRPTTAGTPTPPSPRRGRHLQTRRKPTDLIDQPEGQSIFIGNNTRAKNEPRTRRIDQLPDTQHISAQRPPCTTTDPDTAYAEERPSPPGQQRSDRKTHGSPNNHRQLLLNPNADGQEPPPANHPTTTSHHQTSHTQPQPPTTKQKNTN